MARPRTPTEVLEAKGSFIRHPERKRARSAAPKPSAPLGDPPDLERDEKAAWRELESIMLPNSAKNSDRWWIERAVCLMVLCRKGRASVGEQSLLQGYLVKLGMNPSDRSKIVASESDKPKSAWDDLDNPNVQ